MSEGLPQVMVVEILKRLPVKSLLRFRCVCKSWRSTIHAPYFVDLHRKQASHWRLACLDLGGPDRNPSYLLSGESLAQPSPPQIEIPFADPAKRYGIVGSCNGLICIKEKEVSVKGFDYTMYVWNLFTRKYKAVPPPRPKSDLLPLEAEYSSLGFGFDDKSNDHKIVKILYCPIEYWGVLEPRVEIYSLSTHSWRSLECEVPALTTSKPSVFLNGKLHWYLRKEGDYGSILSFDVKREVFDEMALPEELSHVIGAGLEADLSVLNGLLTVCTTRREANGPPEGHSNCSVWVMREDHVPESWTELYTFEACGEVLGFDGFTRNGKLVMKMFHGGRVFGNPITGQFANLPLSTQDDLVTLMESLVPLPLER